MATPDKTLHVVNYASTKVGTRVWAVMSSDRRTVIETNESLDELVNKWGNEYVYTIIIDQKNEKN